MDVLRSKSKSYVNRCCLQAPGHDSWLELHSILQSIQFIRKPWLRWCTIKLNCNHSASQWRCELRDTLPTHFCGASYCLSLRLLNNVSLLRGLRLMRHKSATPLERNEALSQQHSRRLSKLSLGRSSIDMHWLVSTPPINHLYLSLRYLSWIKVEQKRGFIGKTFGNLQLNQLSQRFPVWPLRLSTTIKQLELPSSSKFFATREELPVPCSSNDWNESSKHSSAWGKHAGPKTEQKSGALAKLYFSILASYGDSFRKLCAGYTYSPFPMKRKDHFSSSNNQTTQIQICNWGFRQGLTVHPVFLMSRVCSLQLGCVRVENLTSE